MSKESKKKTEQEVPSISEPNEAEPVETDPVKQLTKQLQEMMEGFQKDCPIKEHIPAKNRNRYHGVGMKTYGFIDKAFEIAEDNPELAPHFLNVKLLKGKLSKLNDIMSLKDVLAQFAEIVETAYLVYSDDCYHNALLYYDSLKEAVKMRVDAAEGPFKILQPFFKNCGHKHSPRESSLSV
jgi:hypothetical protein